MPGAPEPSRTADSRQQQEARAGREQKEEQQDREQARGCSIQGRQERDWRGPSLGPPSRQGYYLLRLKVVAVRRSLEARAAAALCECRPGITTSSSGLMDACAGVCACVRPSTCGGATCSHYQGFVPHYIHAVRKGIKWSSKGIFSKLQFRT